MHFAQPEYFYLLGALPVLALLLYRFYSAREKKLKTVIGPSMAEKLSADYSRARMILKALFLLGFFFFGVLAAARPQWGTQTTTTPRHGVDIIAALDVSFSMNAGDATPDRFSAARNHIRALLQQSAEDQFGLVVFSGNAALLSPLTMDRDAILMLLDSAATGMLPAPGTSLAAAFETASAAFIEKERKHKALVLYTDGEDLSGAVNAAIAAAKRTGVVIYAVGFGTSGGSPIPLRDDEGNMTAYRKDPEGAIVVSRLDEDALTAVATRTGGRYFRATASAREAASLYDTISSLEKKEITSMTHSTGEERFQYPLALAVLFFIISFLIHERRVPIN